MSWQLVSFRPQPPERARVTKSQIFHTGKYKQIERAIVRLLNSQPDFLSARSASSTRAAGDAI